MMSHKNLAGAKIYKRVHNPKSEYKVLDNKNIYVCLNDLLTSIVPEP